MKKYQASMYFHLVSHQITYKHHIFLFWSYEKILSSFKEG